MIISICRKTTILRPKSAQGGEFHQTIIDNFDPNIGDGDIIGFRFSNIDRGTEGFFANPATIFLSDLLEYVRWLF
jgi:hypothetical protein